MTVKNIFFLIVLLFFVTSCGKNKDNPSAQVNNKDTEKVTTSSAVKTSEPVWYTDWDRGMAVAKNEKKPAIVDFYTDWCGYCKKMEKETFENLSVKEKLSKNWITIRLNAEDATKFGTIEGKKMSNPEITKFFGVSGFPTILFIDKANTPVHPLPGFVPAEPFGLILDYFKDELYNNKVNLDDYVKKGMKQ